MQNMIDAMAKERNKERTTENVGKKLQISFKLLPIGITFLIHWQVIISNINGS